MAERTRKGYSKNDLVSILERRNLGPYPSWAAWEHNLEKEIGEDVYQKQFTDEQKDALHIRYVILIKGKLGIDIDSDQKKYEDLHKILVKKNIDENSNPKFDRAVTFLWYRVGKFRQF